MHDKIVSRSRFRLENTLATRQHTGLTIVSDKNEPFAQQPPCTTVRVPLSVDYTTVRGLPDLLVPPFL